MPPCRQASHPSTASTAAGCRVVAKGDDSGCCCCYRLHAGDGEGQQDSAAGLFVLPCFDIHLTPEEEEENAKGEEKKRSSEERKAGANEGKGKEGSINKKQTLCFTVCFVRGPQLRQIPLLPFLCDFFSPLSFPLPPLFSSSQMCAFVLPVQRLALGFLHSGVLITGSQVSCSHLFPSPLPHLFIPQYTLLISSPRPRTCRLGFLFFVFFKERAPVLPLCLLQTPDFHQPQRTIAAQTSRV